MSAVTSRKAALAILMGALACSPAIAVGLGPLTHSGVTNSERKGFYLTLINPYPTQHRFRLYSIGWDDEARVDRVVIPIRNPVLGPNSRRRILVIDTGLAPGAEHKFRVCAEKIESGGEAIVHARVCSKLTARRVA